MILLRYLSCILKKKFNVEALNKISKFRYIGFIKYTWFAAD